jgi:YgiT-type zinc finger domain-containing protein
MKRDRRQPDSPDHSAVACPYCGSTEKELTSNTDYKPDKGTIKHFPGWYHYTCLKCGERFDLVRRPPKC